jgi:hypothetical protein
MPELILGEQDRMSEFIQVAFAGHNRPEDLGDVDFIQSALADAFQRLRQASIEHARLLCGFAAGADTVAVEQWSRTGLGPVHLVLPFLDDDPPAPEAGIDAVTWLDGVAASREGRNPHLQQTRLIVEAADIVVVVWTGTAAKGAGGTADAVAFALELGRPVLWINPADRGRERLILPEPLPIDFHFLEFLEALQHPDPPHVQEATPETIRAALAMTQRPPMLGEESPPPSRRLVDVFMHRYAGKIYSGFRRLVGGPAPTSASPRVDPPASLEEQHGFMILTRAYQRCDGLANRLSATHRSEQLLLVLAMIAAACVGSAWGIWPNFKHTAVWIEMGISVAALLVWASATDGKQHDRWSQARFLAEQLRLARAGWALGLSIDWADPGAPPDRFREERNVRRRASVPTGRFDPQRVSEWGSWAIYELIQGQADYHHGIGVRDGRIAHRMHLLEDLSFLCLFAVFAIYLVVYAITHGKSEAHWFTGVVSMVGTTMPALGAAVLALDAKLEFGEHSARSKEIAHTLDGLAKKLGPQPSFDTMRHAARAAMRVHVAEAQHWHEGSNRRRLFRP